MNIYDKTVNDIKNARRETEDRGRLVFRDTLKRNTDLKAAYDTYLTQMHLSAQGKPNDYPDAVKRLTKAIADSGLSLSVIDPPHSCKTCNDTGKLSDGSYCPCVINRIIRSDKQNSALPITDFDKCSITATGALKKMYDVASEYIEEFPNNDKPFFIISGTAGTGKTVLASAIATKLMQRGASVVTVTAFSFVRRALDYHTQFTISDYVDRFTPMLDCDLLVIDDLGTESTLKNVTKEYLYTVINERWQQRKLTIITTNLTPSELNARYGENVFSRMCDKSRAVLGRIVADDARLGIKSKQTK